MPTTNTIAQIILDRDNVTVQQDPATMRIIVFKYRGSFCDLAVFEAYEQDEIVEYIITPIPDQRFEYRVDGE